MEIVHYMNALLNLPAQIDYTPYRPYVNHNLQTFCAFKRLMITAKVYVIRY